MKTPTSVTNKITEKALPLEQCLAKTYGDKQEKYGGRQVLNHCQIVGEVARELMARMPDWLRNALFPKGSELIAACHDLETVCKT
jgi:CRISPR-associated endonuclease/helicase Cas3